jgi:CheY-like chemotaxis protein
MAGPRSISDAARGSQGGGTAATGTARRCRVLVVDDDPKVLDSIEAILSQDVDVLTCMTGEQALKILESNRFHLVCADYRLPGMNGLELLDRVSQLPNKTGSLLLTGCSEYTPVQGQSRHYVIFKPFEPARLLALVLQLARLSDMKRSVQSLTDSFSGPESQRPAPSSRMPESSKPVPSTKAPDSSHAPDSRSGPRSTRAPRASVQAPPQSSQHTTLAPPSSPQASWPPSGPRDAGRDEKP